MTEQSTALRLADVLEQDYCSCHEGFKLRNRIDPQCESCQTKDWRNEAAAELRRLHAENQELREEIAELRAWLEVETGRVKQAAPVQEPTRSERMRAAGMTRRPKGWVKDGDEPEGGGNLPPPLQEATVQQQLEDTPPSDYRRGYWDGFRIGKREGRIEAEDALAEPVQEPVLVVEKEPDYWSGGHFHEGSRAHIDPTKVWGLPIGTKLYTAPTQRKPLTDEEIHDCWQQRHRDKATERRLITRAIERAHGIGGNDESA